MNKENKSDRPPQRLHRHVHVNDNDAILWRGLPDAYIFVRFHRDMRERDELRIDPDARKLKITPTTIRTNKKAFLLPCIVNDNANPSKEFLTDQDLHRHILTKSKISSQNLPRIVIFPDLKGPELKKRRRGEKPRRRKGRERRLTVKASRITMGALAAAMATDSGLG
ncbi:hypothetical protein B296_00050242 [Ensete ventricosum]|uniref:Uncharacterized protein n=1 Tax=Ensete ventricosum TaxID=4639 RepID=A0A426XER7_ENSVE|nr:hypothetical protein B296_00050242 [Ensete ventricosum]